ncbi:MAG TPA: DUF488 domain-containing protein [Candidatus Acidoferrales bacterium]
MPNVETRAHPLFTIGHSNLEPPPFLELLRRFEIAVLCDVRSRPQSGRFPQFNQDVLEELLREVNIRYLFLGEELGGRPADPKLYRADGLANYAACRKSFGFRQGVERVLTELQSHAVALMCAEEDPLTCHRFLMICPELAAAGVAPQHIRRGGAIESQREAEDRVLGAQDLSGFSGPSLFAADRSAALEDAYRLQAERCAFRVDPEAVERW